jgi:hypothetical protein
MRNLLAAILAAFTLAAAGCRSALDAKTNGPVQPVAKRTLADLSQPYTRIANPDSNTVQLQIALRKFVPHKHRGPTVWLAGTMHVGEPAYYRAVQKYLDAQNVVLYEGINADAHPRHVDELANPMRKTPGATAADTNVPYSLQSEMAKSLGLVFQLDAIDYDRTNFFNSDLSVQQIQSIMENSAANVPGNASTNSTANQKSGGNESFDSLLQIMDGSSFLGSLVKLGVQFIGANPQLQAITKYTLIEAVGRLKGDMSDLREMPPDMKQLIQVLIQARNNKVISDLKIELKRVPRKGSIAIFYGTGHMANMEEKLETELHYRPAGDVWLTAFSVDLQKSGISPGEALMLRNMVKWQLDQMQQ